MIGLVDLQAVERDLFLNNGGLVSLDLQAVERGLFVCLSVCLVCLSVCTALVSLGALRAPIPI